MEVPNIYLPFGSNVHQRVLSQEKITKHSKILEGKMTSLLFIGCGDCSLFLELLVPALPLTITRIVVTDVSNKVIESANTTYGRAAPRIIFKQLDLLNSELDITETFDCIVSLWYVRWVNNMGVSLQNIKKLLNPNGVGLFMIETNNMFYSTVIENLAKKDKWKKYLTPILPGIPPFPENSAAGPTICNTMRENGLIVTSCYSEMNVYDYYSFTLMRDFFHKSYTAGTLIPENLLNDFYADVFQQMEDARCVSRMRGELMNITLPVHVCVFTFKKEVEKKDDEMDVEKSEEKAEEKIEKMAVEKVDDKAKDKGDKEGPPKK